MSAKCLDFKQTKEAEEEEKKNHMIEDRLIDGWINRLLVKQSAIKTKKKKQRTKRWKRN